jgi:hypothetical protein
MNSEPTTQTTGNRRIPAREDYLVLMPNPTAGRAVVTSAYDRNAWFGCGYANDQNRRGWPVAGYSGDRLLSEPTAATHPWRREPLFMPLAVVQGSPGRWAPWAKSSRCHLGVGADIAPKWGSRQAEFHHILSRRSPCGLAGEMSERAGRAPAGGHSGGRCRRLFMADGRGRKGHARGAACGSP